MAVTRKAVTMKAVTMKAVTMKAVTMKAVTMTAGQGSFNPARALPFEPTGGLSSCSPKPPC